MQQTGLNSAGTISRPTRFVLYVRRFDLKLNREKKSNYKWKLCDAEALSDFSGSN